MLRAFATFPEATEVGALSEDPSSEPRAVLRMDVLQKVSESVPWKAIRSRILAALIDRTSQATHGRRRVDTGGFRGHRRGMKLSR